LSGGFKEIICGGDGEEKISKRKKLRVGNATAEGPSLIVVGEDCLEKKKIWKSRINKGKSTISAEVREKKTSPNFVSTASRGWPPKKKKERDKGGSKGEGRSSSLGEKATGSPSL